MINIEVWLNTYLCALQQVFGDRVCFVVIHHRIFLAQTNPA